MAFLPRDAEGDERPEDVVICNLGGTNIVAGFAGDDGPRSVFPSIVGMPKSSAIMMGRGVRSLFVGDDANARRGILRIKRPIEGGCSLTSADDVEQLLKYALVDELRIDPTTSPLVLVIHPLMKGKDRDALCEIAMNRLKVPRFWMVSAPSMSLFSRGVTSGIVLHIGGSSTYCAAVFEGSVLRSTVTTGAVCGLDMRDYFAILLRNRGMEFTTSAEMRIVDDMKEKLCEVMPKPRLAEAAASVKNGKERKEYELPDGVVVEVLPEAVYGPPEALFDPTCVGLERNMNIVSMVERTLELCPVELRREIGTCVVLSGKSSRFPGLTERLEMELDRSGRCQKALQRGNADAQTVELSSPPPTTPPLPPPLRVRNCELYSSFIGTSIVADEKGRNSPLGDFEGCALSADTYKTYGPTTGRWFHL